ncbi:MAG: hypothetical protein K0B84_08045 [Firmicutes bacterium]|nr:hypothetical protein [Bacillota bacterium]
MNKNILFKVGFIFLCLGTLVSFIYGFLYIGKGTFMEYHERFTGLTPELVAAYNTNLMVLITIFIRIIGFAALTVGILMGIIIFAGLRAKEKWAWGAGLAVGLCFILPLAVLTAPVGGTPYISMLVALVIVLAGLICSFPAVFIQD